MHQQRRAAEAEQRERHAGQREQAQVASDRDDDLDAEQDREAARDQGAVRAPRHAAGEGEPPHQHDRRDDHPTATGDEPVLARRRWPGRGRSPSRGGTGRQVRQRIARAAEERPEPTAMCACRTAQPAPVGRFVHAEPGNCRGAQAGRAAATRSAAGRSRRAAAATAAQDDAGRDPADDRIEPVRTSEEHLVLRYELQRSSEADRYRGEPRAPKANRCHGGRSTEARGEHEQQPELGQLGWLEAELADPDPPGRAIEGFAGDVHHCRVRLRHRGRSASPRP